MAKIQIFKFETIKNLQENIPSSLKIINTMEKQMSGVITDIKKFLLFLEDLQEKDFNEYKDIFQKHAEELNNFINNIKHATKLNDVKIIKNNFQELNKTANNILKEFKIKEVKKDNKIKNFDSQLNDLSMQVDNIKSSIDDEYKDFENTLNEMKKKHQDALSEFENYKKALEEDAKFLAAKDYWDKKSFWHAIKALVSFVIFFAILSSLPLYIHTTGHVPKFVTLPENATYDFSQGNRLAKIVEEEKREESKRRDTNLSILAKLAYIEKSLNNPTDNEKAFTLEKERYKNYLKEINSKDGTLKDPEFITLMSNYAVYFFLISILIWISRIILKIALSNLHLSEEAREKKTMILTYLALIKEGAGLEEKDRKLILEAIFRPSTNGLIKDESNVTLLDIANIFKGK